MAAPKKNKFWTLRSTHGRDRLFATPALLWEAACEYFEWCERNPLIEVDFVGGAKVQKVKKPKVRAFTIQGLCRYLNCNTRYFDDFKDSLEGKDDDLSQDFSHIIQQIKDIIFDQKFSAAAAGLLNANLISRELKISDKTEVTGENGGPLKASYEVTLKLD